MKKLTVLFFVLFFVCISFAQDLANVKYVFLFIGDGMGINHVKMTEKNLADNNQEKLLFPTFPVKTATTTYSANAKITDSAASATAIACGVKTNNGVIGLDPAGNEVESVATFAKKNNRKVGILSSININHATPAAFFAHNIKRSNYNEIGKNLVDSNFDYFAGGAVLDSKKTFNIYELAKQNGFTVIQELGTIDELKNVTGNKLLISVPKTMKYDRKVDNGKAATLADLVDFGISYLDNPNGFFMMTEGGLIDVEAHANKTKDVIGEVIAFNEAILVAYNFAKKHPNETLIVVTTDHETGDLRTEDDIKFKWNSFGHSAADINTFAFGVNQNEFKKADGEKLNNIEISSKLKAMIK